MEKLSCEACLPDINGYYDDSYDVVAINQKLISMAIRHPQGVKLLASGRVVVLHDGVRCRHESTCSLLISLYSISDRPMSRSCLRRLLRHRGSQKMGTKSSGIGY